ncbi:MAG: UDP-glucose 4-epimerase [Patescibacteria group bacterium]|nr:UDP-glucose 4-epimerase GalE [Candidatus Saccharibacteria bacterium]MDQ5963576.1 UDP-glucose 4-epimerase [Patescibacteria group bacterium]
MHVLVTGGAGYIGSHTVLELLESGHGVTIVDNLCNSSLEAIKRVEAITKKSVDFHKFDVCDKARLEALFANNSFDSVIHFAGLKAVGESVEKPLLYYRTNLLSSINLTEVMLANGVKNLVFSSSATVYGTPEALPLTEKGRVGVGLTNPYGKTKYMIEEILRDATAANPEFCITILRYFNPVGAHPSGRIGEDPNGPPNNLLPYVSQVAVGRRDSVTIHGNDYDTPDGTGVRDYIHVVDLAKGHLAALERAHEGVNIYNLGTGTGTSVLEAIETFSKACGYAIPYKVGPRRPGDIASCYAAVEKAQAELGWQAEMTFEQACKDAWRWQSQNPDGYKA